MKASDSAASSDASAGFACGRVSADRLEKLDGSGYPEGLSGSEIPVAVRIVTVADVFDALTNNRAWREALKLETAYEVLFEGVRKGWWDGEAVEELRGAVAELGVIGA